MIWPDFFKGLQPVVADTDIGTANAVQDALPQVKFTRARTKPRNRASSTAAGSSPRSCCSSPCS